MCNFLINGSAELLEISILGNDVMNLNISLWWNVWFLNQFIVFIESVNEFVSVCYDKLLSCDQIQFRFTKASIVFFFWHISGSRVFVTVDFGIAKIAFVVKNILKFVLFFHVFVGIFFLHISDIFSSLFKFTVQSIDIFLVIFKTSFHSSNLSLTGLVVLIQFEFQVFD